MKNLALRLTVSILIFIFSLVLTWEVSIVFLLTPDISITQPKLPERYSLEAEQYAVYSALLTPTSRDESKTLLIIENQTVADELDNDLPTGLTSHLIESLQPLASQETINNYFDRNQQSETLKDHFAIAWKYKLISPEEVKRYFREGGGWWEAFYKKYPKSNGLISLSRVGFNAAGNQAVVYVEYGCGLLYATGKYYLLAKQDGKWEVVQEFMRWVS